MAACLWSEALHNYLLMSHVLRANPSLASWAIFSHIPTNLEILAWGCNKTTFFGQTLLHVLNKWFTSDHCTVSIRKQKPDDAEVLTEGHMELSDGGKSLTPHPDSRYDQLMGDFGRDSKNIMQEIMTKINSSSNYICSITRLLLKQRCNLSERQDSRRLLTF